MPLVTLWFKAFFFTVLVETPIAAALLRPAEPRLARRIALILFANLASHPAVWFIFPALGLSYLPTLLISEAWAVLLEALLYRLVFEKADAVEALGIWRWPTALRSGLASWCAQRQGGYSAVGPRRWFPFRLPSGVGRASVPAAWSL